MKKILSLIVLLVTLSCDDGNIDVPSLEFESTLTACGSYVLYKTNGNEAVAINLESTDEKFFETERDADTAPITLSTTGKNTITYRTFDNTITGANYFCQSVPPLTPNVLKKWDGEGQLYVITTLTFDDGDGIDEPDAIKNEDPDGDKIPNNKDNDDDGDGVFTKDEKKDADGNPVDSDNDSTPDYLDDDDDGDGTPTNEEDANQNGNLLDDDTDSDGIPDYLDADNKDKHPKVAQKPNTYEEIYSSTFTAIPLTFKASDGSEIRYDRFELGVYENKVKKPDSDDDK